MYFSLLVGNGSSLLYISIQSRKIYPRHPVTVVSGTLQFQPICFHLLMELPYHISLEIVLTKIPVLRIDDVDISLHFNEINMSIPSVASCFGVASLVCSVLGFRF